MNYVKGLLTDKLLRKEQNLKEVENMPDDNKDEHIKDLKESIKQLKIAIKILFPTS